MARPIRVEVLTHPALQSVEQKAAKTAAFDLQMEPSAPDLRFHRIERSRDAHFWSIRVNSDLRIIVHKTEAGFLLAYVGHHDDAYTWAERRRIEAHPRTSAVQIVEVRERVEDIVIGPLPSLTPASEQVTRRWRGPQRAWRPSRARRATPPTC